MLLSLGFVHESSAVRQSGIAAFSLFSELIPHVGIHSIFADAEFCVEPAFSRHPHGTRGTVSTRSVIRFASPLLERYKSAYCSVDFALPTKDLGKLQKFKDSQKFIDSPSICIHQAIAEVLTYTVTSQVTVNSKCKEADQRPSRRESPTRIINPKYLILSTARCKKLKQLLRMTK
jgi:hypothetical protein